MLKVLVVDDSPVTRRMLARALSLTGLPIESVHEAGDGVAALAQMREHWIDLVLSDLHMPEMSGLDMVREMARDGLTAQIPVVIVSSNRSKHHADELAKLGARAYVHKPVQPEALGRVLRQVLGFCRPLGVDDLPRGEVAVAHIAHFALADEIVQRLQRLQNGCIGVRPMDLIQVDVVGLQAAQAGLDRSKDVVA
jgi:two-component system chemotaxis response regulator CheY